MTLEALAAGLPKVFYAIYEVPKDAVKGLSFEARELAGSLFEEPTTKLVDLALGGGGGRTFAAAVLPILQKSTCYDCHDGSDGAKVKGKFNLMDPESVKKMVTAGDDVNSEFIGRLTDASDPMPPEGKGDMLSTDDVAKIKAWINAGAKF